MRTTLLFASSLLLFVACTKDPDDPTDEGPSDTDTDTDTDTGSTDTGTDDTNDTDTGTTETGDTGTTVTAACEESEAHVGARSFFTLWAAPTGEALASGTLGASTRSATGTWTDDADLQAPLSASWLDGSSMDEIWAVGTYDVWRRDPLTTTWAEVPFAGQPWDTVGLHVTSPTDVTIVTKDVDGYGVGDTTVHRYDGASWSTQTRPITSWIDRSAQLPDGRVLLAGASGVLVEDGAGFDVVPTPRGLRPSGLAVADDGTILAFGAGVALGDDTGLADIDPGLYGVGWWAGALRGADDVWLLGWDQSYEAVLLHHDGSAWTPVPLPAGELPITLALTDDEVLLTTGDPSRRTVLSGDASGVTAELDEPWLDALDALAVDDVEGTVWAFGEQGMASFDGTTWTAQPYPAGDLGRSLTSGVSDGRVALFDYQGLWIMEGGAATFTDTPEEHITHVITGVGGTLFALGNAYIYDGPAIGPVGYIHEGTDWALLDLSGLPSSVDLVSAWADAPDDVWIGLETGNREGALAHWDGTSATVVATGLPEAPDWMARQSDGLLWMAVSAGAGRGDGLFTWNGATLTALPDTPPDVRSAHRMPDGTFYVSTIEEVPTSGGDEDLRGRVYRSDATGWTQVLDSENVVPLAGHDALVVASRDHGSVAWWATCTP